MLEGDPCTILDSEFVKPGKGQAFTRVKLRNLITGRVWDRTYRSGESLPAADVLETEMEFLYDDGEFWHFMKTDGSFEQVAASASAVGDAKDWLLAQEACSVTLWNNEPISVTPPNFVELEVARTDPGSARRHGSRRRQTGRTGYGSDGSRATVHRDRRRTPGRHAFRRVRQPREGLTRVRGGARVRVMAGDPVATAGSGLAAAPDWRPSCSVSTLRQRGALLAEVRAFFAAREVLEVQTPVVGRRTVLDPALDSIATREGRFLQTSPEYHMKRLLAAGAPSIYQIAPAFRDGEAGRRHNPEFTMLEWYRVGFDAPALMAEVAALVDRLLGDAPYDSVACADLLRERFDIDIDDPATLLELGRRLGLAEPALDEALDLALAEALSAGGERRVFVTGFPAALAALARIGADGCADRFELIVDGVEVANGYHELADAAELAARMEADAERRRALGKDEIAPDEALLAAHQQGLPDCAGVAMGLDRLLMLKLGTPRLADVMAFSWDRA